MINQTAKCGSMLLKGNCLDTLKTLPDNSVDSIVTDPPYELGFMGKSWDNSGIAYSTDLWAECLRVLKPGGHLLAFSGSRTYHRMVVAIEDSGFEIRDQIMWLYGSGFPKSLDVSKAIDKKAGTLKIVGKGRAGKTALGQSSDWNKTNNPHEFDITEPNSPEAQQWQGWGTALKPAHEPIVVARKPIIGTVANNVLTYGTGALNIDGSRVGTEVRKNNINDFSNQHGNQFGNGAPIAKLGESEVTGRWPANVIHDGLEEEWSRFFYCAKASKSERNAGLEGLPERGKVFNGQSDEPAGNAEGSVEDKFSTKPAQNFHPTVKPLALMRYLVKLVTPPSGTVLDPFLGSGSTAVAAILEGFEWIGCEMTEDYFPIIEARVKWALNQPKPLVL